MGLRRWVIGALLLSNLGAPPLIAGTPKDKRASKRAFDRARHEYALGEFEAALALFKEAYEAAPLPGLLFNIAQCHRNLGNTQEAIFFFERYLEEHPHPADEDQIHSLLDELRQIERDRLTAVHLASAPPPQPRTATVSLPPDPPPPPPDSGPITEKWWFWTGLVATAAVVTGAAVLAVRAADDDRPDDPIATFDYR